MHLRSPAWTENDFYRRGEATLLAAWDACARGSAGAELVRSDGFAAGVFPSEPERSFYNNVLLRRGLDRAQRKQAIRDVESVYANAGVDRYAVWAHESEVALRAELSGSDYELEETTRVMGISLEDVRPGPTEVECEPVAWPRYVDYLAAAGAPDGILSGVDPAAFHALGVRLGSDYIATSIALDHDGDCGIYNMSTLEQFRRRGLATALLLRQLHDASERGCSTASLQATPIAEGIYAAVGFRDLDRFFEYVPAASRQ